MWDLNDVTNIEYRGGQVYRVRFDDGLEGDVDFTGYVNSGPVFAALSDPEFFRKAAVEGGTIVWPNGADIAPETLYEMVEAAGRRMGPGTRPKSKGGSLRRAARGTPSRTRDRS
jgi:hypothetical protein